ncbi:MAG: hypothetical protein ACFB0B_16350 [Thermonemataceae bacterium]
MKKVLFTWLLSVATTSLFAQITYGKRIEIELTDDFYSARLATFGQAGLLLKSRDENNKRRYAWYDTDLNLVEEKFLQLSNELSPRASFTNAEATYTLHANTKKGKFTLVTFTVDGRSIQQTSGQLPKKCLVGQMVILGDYAYCRATVKKRPLLFTIQLATGRVQIIPVSIGKIKSKNTNLYDLQLIEGTNEVWLYVKGVINKRTTDTFIVKLNILGNKTATLSLTEKEAKILADVSALPTKRGRFLLAGTYTIRNKYPSEGIYFGEMENDQMNYLKFYEFAQLDNFLSFLPEETQEKIERKKTRKASRGKSLEFNYYIAPHEIITRDDGYILIGEACYPTYDIRFRTEIIDGRSREIDYYVFDGYQYTHAFVVKFDFNGTPLWDESFSLRPSYKPFSPIRFMTVTTTNDNLIKMTYASRGKVVYKIIDDQGEVVQEKETEPIETLYEGDKTKWSVSDLRHWYGDYFVAHGRQEIKNKGKKNKKVDRKRQVFFMSKTMVK